MRKIFSQKKQMVKDNVIIYLEIEIDEKESKIYANNEIVWTEHWATVAWDSWSTPRALGRKRELPGTAG